MLERWKQAVRLLKQKTLIVYFALKDPRTPWHVRALLFLVAAHAFSPIDLIPDFIPVLGYLDDLIITPLGFYTVYRLIPEAVLRDAEKHAAANPTELDRLGRMGTIIIVSIWGAILAAAGFWLWRTVRR